MEIIVKAVLFDELETFDIVVTKQNSLKIRMKLEQERDKIIKQLRTYKDAGLIKSIFYPRNKKMQEHLDKLVKCKKEMKKSLSKLIKVFRKT